MINLFHASELSQQQFQRSHWQQEHCLFRGAALAAKSIISRDTLLALAGDEDVESRIIVQSQAVGDKPGPTNGDSQWQLYHGPFTPEQLNGLPPSHWTLLVQAVDQQLSAIAQLFQSVDFLPRWRLDDIMISYAVDGGNVGPHFDQYDVFLVQVSGKRHWRIGQHCNARSQVLSDSELCLLADFDTQAEYQLEPGDVLYVPPGQAHFGIAEGEDCITLSIGFRAPSASEVLSALADNHNQRPNPFQRYRDPAEPAAANADATGHGEIREQDISTFQALLRELIDDRDTLAQTLGSLLSETKYVDYDDPEDFSADYDEGCDDSPLESNYQEDSKRISAGDQTARYRIAGDGRMNWFSPVQSGRPRFFANGGEIFGTEFKAFANEAACIESLKQLAAQWPHQPVPEHIYEQLPSAVIEQLLNCGYLVSAPS